MPYQIKNWNDHFENDRSRQRKKCAWCPMPNKQDGLGYGLIMMEPDGPAIYGAFVALVLMCSKQGAPRDGWLTENGQPTGRALTPKELCVKTKIPPESIARALEITSEESVGWIDKPQSDNQRTANTPPTHLEEKRREGNRIEGKGEKRAPAYPNKNVEAVCTCRPEFSNLDPAAIAKILHDFQASENFERNLQEFICDAANAIEAPRSATAMLRAYLNHTPRKAGKPETDFSL